MRTNPTPLPGDLDRTPFSNSTEGETWTANVCGAGDGCIHDSTYGQSIEDSDDLEVFCPLITLSLSQVWPREWERKQITTSSGSYTTPGACSEYSDQLPAVGPDPVIAVDLFGEFAAEPSGGTA